MPVNNVRRIREARGFSLEELARRANIMPWHLRRLEELGWERSPWGLTTDLRIAEALGVALQDVFPAYGGRQQEEPPAAEPPREAVGEEELAELNRRWREMQRIYSPLDAASFERTQPGVWEGIGNFQHWQQVQKKRAEEEL